MSSVGGRGWALGKFFSPYLFEWLAFLPESLAAPSAFIAVETGFLEFGIFLVFLGAFSPLPYKVIAVSAGLGGFGILPFILTSIAGRGLRFTIIAGIAKNKGNPRIVILLITILICLPGRLANQMTPNFIKLSAIELVLWLLGNIATLLSSALLFQYVGNFLPCNLCIWQRWPHLLVIILAFAGLQGFLPRGMLWLIFIAGIVSVSLGAYHAGVEYGFWTGPTGCTANLALHGSVKALTQQLLATPLVRCDEVAWSLFGLSMAGWNALISLDIVASFLSR